MTEVEANGDGEAGVPPPKLETQDSTENNGNSSEPVLSKSALKKQARQQRWEVKMAAKKAAAKEQKKKETERKRKEWEESLASMPEDERTKFIESRISLRKERMEQQTLEKNSKKERLNKSKEHGQNVVIDLQFSHLMTPSEIRSLVQQIMFCYAVNGRYESPAHLWLTGCEGEMDDQLKKIQGFDKWIIEKENKPYIEALQDRKDDLVYLTADSETVLEELDLKKIYIIGGLVDRNRWKGITMEKAQEQGIQTAKLPIANFMKMSSSQVLTVNQVVEILLKFIETRDWKTSFFAVIPQRKRSQADPEGNAGNTVVEEEEEEEERELKDDPLTSKKHCVEEIPSNKLVDRL
ncbi:unnamed protein product [Lathyrus sativus]|nr:unnamed protein product [Lathyrus sativus]